MIDLERELVYDDFTLFSREVSTIKSRFDEQIKLSTPVYFGDNEVNMGVLMSAPMLDVSGTELCNFLGRKGHIGVLHRFMTPEEQGENVRNIMWDAYSSGSEVVSFSVGIHDSENKLNEILKEVEYSEEDGRLWLESGGNFLICIDTANGSSELILPAIENINSFRDAVQVLFPNVGVEIMAGNIVTEEAAEFLVENGVKFLRVGIGGGSVCTTPMATGIFRPVASAIAEIDAWREDNDIDCYIVADGGIKGAGDVMKAIAVGADFAMMGSLFAGFTESNGSPHQAENGTMYKLFRGMASYDMAKLNNKVNNLKKGIIPEGVTSKVPYKGSIKDRFWGAFVGSMRSAMSYANARSLEEFRDNIEIVTNSVNTNMLRRPHKLDV